jgi:DMSO/TMAO reductase YedYZ heme-binding membrane subunit
MPCITAGVAACLLLPPTAASTQGWIRLLGGHWTRVYRLVYAITILTLPCCTSCGW